LTLCLSYRDIFLNSRWDEETLIQYSNLNRIGLRLSNQREVTASLPNLDYKVIFLKVNQK